MMHVCVCTRVYIHTCMHTCICNMHACCIFWLSSLMYCTPATTVRCSCAMCDSTAVATCPFHARMLAICLFVWRPQVLPWSASKRHTHTCIYIYIYVCIYVYMYIYISYIYIYICTYIYTYIHLYRRREKEGRQEGRREEGRKEREGGIK